MHEPQADLKGRTILVVDDEQSMREFLEILLTGEGFQVMTAPNGRAALEVFERKRGAIDLVIQDLKMPGIDGVELLRRFKERCPDLPVVVITAFSTWDSAVEAMRLGSYDYIRKPFDTDVIRSVVTRAIEQRLAIQNAPAHLRDELSYKSEIIGNNRLMQELFGLIKRIAPTDSTVLIRGESGTGKELVARSIHYRSFRRGQPFVSVNCSAFTESLLESELFGHVKGSFTGAIENKQGLFQAASGGTLFLDEVVDMSLTTQVKMLRVLEERKVVPVGSTRPEAVDVRIIAATNRIIEQAVRERAFREDLFYRLNVIPLFIPPLRDRKEDIPLLAGYFLARYSKQMRKEVSGISPTARLALSEYGWPGNVRELENIIQRHVALCDGNAIERITLPEASPAGQTQQETVPAAATIPPEGFSLSERLDDYERDFLREALRVTGGNLTNAAKILGMSYRSIRYRVKKLGIKSV